MATLHELRAQRLAHLTQLQEKNIAGYPSIAHRTHTIAKALASFPAEQASSKQEPIAPFTLVGRILSWRSHGKSTFCDILDATGKIQCYFKTDLLEEQGATIVPHLDIGDIIQVTGTPFITKMGEKTIKVTALSLLTKALRPLPEKWHGIKDEETRFRKRYLELLTKPELRTLFIQKSKFWQTVRTFMTEHGFIEVETPVLETCAGGADANPFITHHDALDIDVYLRISMGELWQKRLMVGGFEKTFEIGRQFRNEGMSREHLQDYTQMEFYWAYASYRDSMQLVEQLYRQIAKETFGTLQFTIDKFYVDFSGDWEKIDYVTIVREQVGIDLLSATDAELRSKLDELKVKHTPGDQRGRLMDMIWKTVRKGIAGPAFLINHPVEVSPLAKRKADDPRLVERFQVILAGSEMGNGYSELNDPLDQAARFAEQATMRAAGDSEAQMHDQDFVEALEHGMPPTTGFGLSERLFSFLANLTVRECVLFPLMRPEAPYSPDVDASPSPSPSPSPSSSPPVSDMTPKETRTLTKTAVNRSAAQELFHQHVLPASKPHMLAVEAAMRALARHFGEDEHTWGIAGLLHDIDWDVLGKSNLTAHCGQTTIDLLTSIAMEPELITQIRAHCELTELPRDTLLAKALFAVDELTGIIIATALVRPSQSLADVEVKSVKKKLKDKAFCANVDREHIYTCESELGIPRDEFISITLNAMKEIEEQLLPQEK